MLQLHNALHMTSPTTALLLFVLGLNIANGADDKLDPQLKNITSPENVEVIVQFRNTPTAAHHQRILARGGQLK